MYEQMEGFTMGSPLSLVVSNLFMENLERQSINSSSLKPKWWLRYVDDLYSNWPHGAEKLVEFTKHLNIQSKSIKFTIEKEENKCLSFLNVLTTKKQDGSLAHEVYRKKTHTDRYLHAESHHNLAQKIGIIKTLATRALRICNKDHLAGKIEHLKKAFLSNGYNGKQINETFKKARRAKMDIQRKDNYFPKTTLPYIHGTIDKIAKILRKRNISVSFSPPNSLINFPDSAKDPIDKKTPKSCL